MLSHILFVLVAITSLGTTQTIDPGSIPLATRDQWCQQQQTSCPLICMQLPNSDSTEQNKCDSSTLDFSCICGNGQSPNSSEYSQTIPYFICTAYNSQCQTNCNGNSTCQAACVQDHPCGAQDPIRYNTTSTTAATATATTSSTGNAGNVVYTGWGTAAGAAATGSSDGNTGGASRPLFVEIGQFYGLLVVVGGLIGGIAVVL